MKKIIPISVLVFSVLLVPSVSFAALGGVKQLLLDFGGILNIVIKVIFGLAMVFFFWGTAQFILAAGDSKARTEGRNKMIWGIVALFVMFSFWGILNFVGCLIGIDCHGGTGAVTPTSPTFIPRPGQPLEPNQ